MGRMTVERWQQAWLPIWPLASDDLLHGLYRQGRPEARTRRYIEANPQALSNLLIVDCDHADAALRALSTRDDHPMPNVIVENPTNGHAHAVWALSEPVTRTEYARRKPLAYAAAVTEGLRRALDGDRGYSGLITKNPEHESWSTYWVSDQLHSLHELANGLGGYMPRARWREHQKPADTTGLGRNCAIFETARTWAYRSARTIRLSHEHATREDAQVLLTAISEHVNLLNASYPEPLLSSEARGIASSIHRWITTRFYGWTDSRTVSQAAFTTIQSSRGRKSGKSRQERSKTIAEGLI